MDTTIAITHQLVQKLDRNTIKPRVFFVNFIKYRNPNETEQQIISESDSLKIHIPYDYYEWGGFLMPNFIIKVPNEVDQYLKTIQTHKKYRSFLKALSNDEELKLLKKPLYESIRSCVIDITPAITIDQIESLHPNLDIEGGVKRPRKKRKTRKYKKK